MSSVKGCKHYETGPANGCQTTAPGTNLTVRPHRNFLARAPNGATSANYRRRRLITVFTINTPQHRTDPGTTTTGVALGFKYRLEIGLSTG